MQYDKFIYFDENYCVQVDNRDECIDEIIKEYHKYDSSMYDISKILEYALKNNVFEIIYKNSQNQLNINLLLIFCEHP